MLEIKGFGKKWGDWVMKTVSGGKVAIRTNNLTSPFFSTHNGVRQGDPLSPLLLKGPRRLVFWWALFLTSLKMVVLVYSMQMTLSSFFRTTRCMQGI
jgi:hypothetical protein